MNEFPRRLKIGTRGSPLAMVQAETVCAELESAHPDLQVEIVKIKTSGDWRPEDGETRLAESEGGKGLFAKEIERALLDGEIDAAVHSMKDMDSVLPDGLMIDHMLPREDVRDAMLFSNEIKELAKDSQFELLDFSHLHEGAMVGTASVRREAFLRNVRPDLCFSPMRGNVGTRIEKVRRETSGQKFDCTLLAVAGLKRLGLEAEADFIFAPEALLPAAGQGAVGIEVRADNKDVLAIISQISCETTVACVKAEREVLRVLDGSCHTPIAAYAILQDGVLWLRAKVVSLDGTESFEDEIRENVSNIEDAQAFGRELGERLKAQIPGEILGHAA